MEQKRYDLEDRTLGFAQNTRIFIKTIPRTLSNNEDAKQLIRASGSVGANYIEANESLGKKDFLLHIKICRKEAKEARYWFSLLELKNDEKLKNACKALEKEATELMNIFGSILRKSRF